MKIVFFEHRYGTWVSRLIRWKTATWKERFNGNWRDLSSHAELLFSDGMMFSSSFRTGARFKKHNFHGLAWERYDINISPQEEIKLRNWCITQVGKKYDFLGDLGFVLPFVQDDPKRWFCSEVCFEALKRNTSIMNRFDFIDSAKVSPARLKNIVLKVMGGM